MRLKFIIINILLLTNYAFSQNAKDIIAKVGDKVITAEELKYRFEFTPQIKRQMGNLDKAKEELLYTIIAENLFALEAERLGYDTTLSMKLNYEPLEKAYVRDALYYDEIKDKVKFDVNKFSEGMNLASFKLFVDYVFSKDEPQINDAYKLLKSNSNFDSLVTLLKNVEYVSEPYEVTYGKMYYKAEQAIYSLNLNEFTEPIESPEGWYIFRLISKIPAVYKTADQKSSYVKKVVEDRIEDSIYNNFWDNFFKELKVTTDGGLFWYFAEKLQNLVVTNKQAQNIKDGERIVVSSDDFARLRNQMHPDSLNKPFIRFENTPITLSEFIADFAFDGFYTFTTDLNIISGQINSRVKRQIELELLTRDGYKKGFESLPEVKGTTEIWKDNYLATLYRKDEVLNTKLTENDLKELIAQNNDSLLSQTKINIIEILTDSLEIVKEALSLSDNETLFRQYASKHTKRNWTKEKGGEFGYFSISEYGEIGEIASTMSIGDVYGPLQTNEGYSVFKLIDKKEQKIENAISKLNEEEKNNLRYNKVMQHLEDLTVDLAEKYNISVNEELLKSLQVINTQMVVFKYLGFGGKILAFPYSSPFFKWKEKWEQKKKEAL
ncbi:MAG: peptidyl-prolyl cis-trans isomerase [Ignavibacteriae bacterium]|nr:peptidyl-prolyl cis-trans isomerase [Ignavibacteriota bacterium]MCB9209553.1 peptidyl-prolyl cis-trans isomerase [Ignavibacteriales bacterium]MCB9258196.1 peptidyl-prolyl cis-trans isomerase [Ignavibacteriales bacterium]